MPTSLDSLPPELFPCILDHVPSHQLQQTALTIIRSTRNALIPLHYLFQFIYLRHAEQLTQLYWSLRFCARNAGATSWIQEFHVQTWTVDADVLINLVRLLSGGNLRALSLFVGSTFSPEHLEEIFSAEHPLTSLESLQLRFKQYVERPTYVQFHRGVYFDSTLHTLSKWPRSRLICFSFIQEPAPEQKVARFAQPLVLFRLDGLAKLTSSPLLSTVKNLRFRIHSRQIDDWLAGPRYLKVLDLGTCIVNAEKVFETYPALEHLLFDGDHHLANCAPLGKSCALVGVKRAKTREASLKTYLNANMQTALPVMEVLHAKRARRGRKGLATATISLRASPPRASTSLPSSSTHVNAIPRIRILPPSPSLLSICISATEESRVQRNEEFLSGWADGMAQLAATKQRLLFSIKNGTNLAKFEDRVGEWDENSVANGDETALDGLVTLPNDEALACLFDAQDELLDAPSLCFAGPVMDQEHAPECGHQIWRANSDYEL